MSSMFNCPKCGQAVPAQVPPGTQLCCPLCNALITAPMTPPTAGGPISNPYIISAPVRQGLAIGALVCGILGVLTCFPIFGIVALILGIVALVKANSAPTQYGGKGMAIAGICTGGVSLLILLPIMVAILLPSLARAREMARREVCRQNMMHVGMALHTYANDNNEQFPPNLDVLVANGAVSPKALACPSASQANYVYAAAGLTADTPPRTVILYEPITNHEEGGNVCFADGHVEFVKQPEYDKAVGGSRGAPVLQPSGPMGSRGRPTSRPSRGTK